MPDESPPERRDRQQVDAGKPLAGGSKKGPGSPKTGGGAGNFSSQPFTPSSSERYRDIDETTITNLAAINRRLEKIEGLLPMVEEIRGFIKHSAPFLAAKHDVEKARSETLSHINNVKTELSAKIDSRPTTITIVSLLAMFAALLALPIGDWMRSAHSYFSGSQEQKTISRQPELPQVQVPQAQPDKK